MDIILASASPRRRELLEMLGVKNLRIIPAQGQEVAPEGASPAETVTALSRGKALEVAATVGEDCVVIAADTMVFLDGERLGKPADEAEALAMLRALSGRSHEVLTGVTLVRGDTVMSEYERTVVRFRELTESEMLAYIGTKETMDKAGAYGAQGIGSLFVEAIDGDFFNVVGLPLCRLGKMLEKLGVKLL